MNNHISNFSDSHPLPDTSRELPDSIGELRSRFMSAAKQAASSDQVDMQVAASLLVDLLSVAELFADDSELRQRAVEIASFCHHQALPAFVDQSAFAECGVDAVQMAEHQWGEYLSLLSAQERYEVTEHQQHDNQPWPDDQSWPDDQTSHWSDPDLVADSLEFGKTAELDDNPQPAQHKLDTSDVPTDSAAARAPAVARDSAGVTDSEQLPDPDAIRQSMADLNQLLASIGVPAASRSPESNPGGHAESRPQPANNRQQPANTPPQPEPPANTSTTPASDRVFRTTVPAAMPTPPLETESIDDPDMVAVYADDAQLCLEEMEASLLSLDAGQPGDEALRNFCRQLHTLKGASGTVGLMQMAHYLHELETWIEAAHAKHNAAEAISVDGLLQCVDVVRAQLNALTGTGDDIAATTALLPASQPMPPRQPLPARPPASCDPAADSAAIEPSAPNAADGGQPGGPSSLSDNAGVNVADNQSANAAATAAAETPATAARQTAAVSADSDGFVRVEAAQLERLMDLLAELVMLRNHRESHVSALRTVHEELNLCALRARTLTNTIDLADHDAYETTVGLPQGPRRQAANARLLARSLHEIAHDTAELSRSLQEVFEPLSSDNAAVSHLIGRFRQELMELRRVPVGGLFQRLQRSIRDAARAEGKQVEIIVEGQGARAERGVQQRLFEPLLHLVRNAVSHGIQTPQARSRAGKPVAGRITLSAWSDAASLSIEIRDDGNGLDESALEERGRQLGLLSPGEAVTSAQLRQLIFHPGFSTKQSVSEISGRGVGMDVVDNWVRRLRGRIDVESTAGQGTTFRLQIPLRSAVEHAMLVRVCGQLFALPMHTVSGTSDAKNSVGSVLPAGKKQNKVALAKLLNLQGTPSDRGCLIRLRSQQKPAGKDRAHAESGLTICVDAVVGVEEVVVRSLPPLLQRNELFAGVTLSGRAEIVLLLDAERLIELAKTGCPEQPGESISSPPSANAKLAPDTDAAAVSAATGRPCILIVDDSVVVRKTLTRKLQSAGIDTQEADNGHAALKVLKHGNVSGVVTDMDMPGMTGLELLHEIKRQKQLRSIPVIVLSSRDEESMPQEIHVLKPLAIVGKPVTDVTVSRIITAFENQPAFQNQPEFRNSKAFVNQSIQEPQTV